MANAKRERPLVLRWRSAVLNSAEPASVKLTLLALAEFANSSGGDCIPGFPALAALTTQSEKTCRRSMDVADDRWFTRVPVKLSGKDWRAYSYTLRIPEGADTVTAGSRKGADPVTGPNGGRSGHLDEKVRTSAPDGAVTVSTVLGKVPSKKHLGGKAKPFLTLMEWRVQERDDEGKLVPAGDPIFDFRDEAGIPDQFLYLAWRAFLQRYEHTDDRCEDWRERFRRSVREGWFKVWTIDRSTGDYLLTTVGLQLQKQLEYQDERAA